MKLAHWHLLVNTFTQERDLAEVEVKDNALLAVMLFCAGGRLRRASSDCAVFQVLVW